MLRHLYLLPIEALSIASFVGATGCSSHPSEPECRLMLDRYVTMRADADPRVANANGVSKAVVRDELIDQKRHESTYAIADVRCQREVSRSAYDCAIAAPGPNEWEACVQ